MARWFEGSERKQLRDNEAEWSCRREKAEGSAEIASTFNGV